jgi:hypothetical protein
MFGQTIVVKPKSELKEDEINKAQSQEEVAKSDERETKFNLNALPNAGFDKYQEL